MRSGGADRHRGPRYGQRRTARTHLELAPFEEEFYMPPGTCAWLIQKTGPFNTVGREYTLEEARAAHVL